MNVASAAAFDAKGSTIAYAAAKTGVVSLTKNFARALSPEVRVNAVAPRFIDSTWISWSVETLRASVEKPLLKRIAKPADIAEVIIFLGFGAHGHGHNGAGGWRSQHCMTSFHEAPVYWFER